MAAADGGDGEELFCPREVKRLSGGGGMADGGKRQLFPTVVEEEMRGWAPLQSLVKCRVGAERQKERPVGARAMSCLPSASTGSPGQSGM